MRVLFVLLCLVLSSSAFAAASDDTPPVNATPIPLDVAPIPVPDSAGASADTKPSPGGHEQAADRASEQKPPVPQPKHEAVSDTKAPSITDAFSADLKKNCARQFPSALQTDLRAACSTVASAYPRFGKFGAQTKCRLSYGEEPRDVLSCLIGVEIRAEMEAGKEDYKKRLQLCSEQYPASTEIDSILQESCLVGIYLPALMTDKPKFETCGEISPERTFIGPCTVGLSLAGDLTAPIQPNRQNQICEQYFDHKQFHTGYRACLNGRSAGLDLKSTVDDVLRVCAKVTADEKNDTERAACFVGANIYRHLLKQDDVDKRFQKCGKNKVSYEDRDFLACLTAASLLDFSSRIGSETGCKVIFKTGKSSGRSDCLTSLNLFP